MPYCVPTKVLAADVNACRALRTSRLCEMIQEATIAHTEALGAGRALTLDRGLLWVVMQLRLEIFRMPAYDEDVVLETWPGDMMHVLFPRYSVLRDAHGQDLARASALWMLMDQDTRRMAFPEQCGVEVAGEDGPIKIPLPAKLRDEAFSTTDELRVSFSLCDINGHLGNARYLDLADDRFARVAAGAVPHLIEVEYAHEVACGTQLELSVREDEKTSYLRGTVEGTPSFRLRYTW